MMGDGQVSMGNMVVKPNAKKIRRIFPKTIGGKVKKGNGDDDDGDEGASSPSGGTIVGFAGSTADAFTLLERLEGKLDEYPGQLARSCVELAKGWRTDKYLRRLEASLLVADENISLEITVSLLLCMIKNIYTLFIPNHDVFSFDRATEMCWKVMIRYWLWEVEVHLQVLPLRHYKIFQNLAQKKLRGGQWKSPQTCVCSQIKAFWLR